VLRQVGVASHVERSRSKGYHLWVFFTEEMPAFDVRTGLMAACNVVGAPTKEVNPKQVELSDRGWGNGVRLPYGKNRPKGGHNEMTNPDATISMIPVHAFTKAAMESLVTPEAWEAVTALYSPPEAPVGDELNVVAGELEGADRDWGGKYARRPDGRQRLWKMVLDAKKLAWEPKG
jgi:hypothetical protein